MENSHLSGASCNLCFMILGGAHVFDLARNFWIVPMISVMRCFFFRMSAASWAGGKCVMFFSSNKRLLFEICIFTP